MRRQLEELEEIVGQVTGRAEVTSTRCRGGTAASLASVRHRSTAQALPMEAVASCNSTPLPERGATVLQGCCASAAGPRLARSSPRHPVAAVADGLAVSSCGTGASGLALGRTQSAPLLRTVQPPSNAIGANAGGAHDLMPRHAAQSLGDYPACSLFVAPACHLAASNEACAGQNSGRSRTGPTSPAPWPSGPPRQFVTLPGPCAALAFMPKP
mmetsp:Transcript_42520/g.98563  ORF Transcript_42520/g.98563 Transcript_42520/m.98563 type:complete len:213 (-) Transcript_42520:171-809(-)